MGACDRRTVGASVGSATSAPRRAGSGDDARSCVSRFVTIVAPDTSSSTTVGAATGGAARGETSGIAWAASEIAGASGVGAWRAGTGAVARCDSTWGVAVSTDGADAIGGAETGRGRPARSGSSIVGILATASESVFGRSSRRVAKAPERRAPRPRRAAAWP
jgi:hypothetical protein